MNANEMIPAIVETLAGLPRGEAIKALIGALAHVAADLKRDDLDGEVSRIKSILKKKCQPAYQPVLDYLETVEEYSSLDQLRGDLVKRFGEASIPSRSQLHRYIQQMRRGNM